jgi:hypothetical protein
LVKEAKWDEVRKALQEAKRSCPCPTDINGAAQWLQDEVRRAIENNCTRSRPSTYSKRWWTPGLTTRRKEFMSLRNRARKLR